MYKTIFLGRFRLEIDGSMNIKTATRYFVAYASEGERQTERIHIRSLQDGPNLPTAGSKEYPAIVRQLNTVVKRKDGKYAVYINSRLSYLRESLVEAQECLLAAHASLSAEQGRPA